MSRQSDAINRELLEQYRTSGLVVVQRMERHCVPIYDRKVAELQSAGQRPASKYVLDYLGQILVGARPAVQRELDGIDAYRIGARTTEEEQVRIRRGRNNWIKSNAGKIFERLVGFSLANALVGTNFAIWPFRNDAHSKVGFGPEDTLVNVEAAGEQLSTPIEADFVATRIPNSQDSPILLISVKSTLKDRFHMVGFWKLLLDVSVSPVVRPEITASNSTRLSRCKYVVVCTDIAEEQPDLAHEPRNLIKIDAAVLDFAFASLGPEATFLGVDFGRDEGGRNHIFHRLSAIVDLIRQY